jgi:hypothetical protein
MKEYEDHYNIYPIGWASFLFPFRFAKLELFLFNYTNNGSLFYDESYDYLVVRRFKDSKILEYA